MRTRIQQRACPSPQTSGHSAVGTSTTVSAPGAVARRVLGDGLAARQRHGTGAPTGARGVLGAIGIAVGVVVSLAVSGCGTGSPSRGDVLGDLADETIVPAYQQFEADTAALRDTVTALCLAPSAALVVDARNALTAARQSWSFSEAMWAGPVMERRSWAVVRWPVASDEIEALISDRSVVLDLDRLTNRIGADQRGLGALEYILHSEDDPFDRTPGTLSALGDVRRCEYAQGVATVIAQEAMLLAEGWTEEWEGGEPFREQISDSDSDGVDLLVNDSLFLLESITDLELGAALGAMGGPPKPDAIDEGPSAAGVDDLLHRLAGVEAVLVGAAGTGQGLAPLLVEDLAARLREGFAEARRAASALTPPLRNAVVESPDAAVAARDAIKAVQVIVATEVVGRLGVTIGFSDADGDSSG